MKKILAVIIIAACACRKSNTVNNTTLHYLGITIDRTVKKGQAVTIYDSTALGDSLDYFYPPTYRTYEWSVIPNDSCVTFQGDYLHGRADIIFHCPGVYKISAIIHDSASLHIEKTNTVEITVANDTLYPATQIRSNDTLVMHIARETSPVKFTRIFLNTTSLYDYAYPATQLKYTVDGTGDGYTIKFRDSVYLVTYPFVSPHPYALSNDTKSHAIAGINIDDLDLNVPVNLTVTWLGVTYHGTITRENNNAITHVWDNTGAVRITY